MHVCDGRPYLWMLIINMHLRELLSLTPNLLLRSSPRGLMASKRAIGSFYNWYGDSLSYLQSNTHWSTWSWMKYQMGKDYLLVGRWVETNYLYDILWEEVQKKIFIFVNLYLFVSILYVYIYINKWRYVSYT